MKRINLIAVLMVCTYFAKAQETLQTVTDRGNVATNSLQIGGYSVNSNTTKLFINNPYGKNWALSSGANMITENGFHIYNWTDKPNAPLFTLTNEGNIGIGTFSPTATLDVNGSAIITGPGNTLTLKKGNNHPALAFQGAASNTVIEGGDDYLKAYVAGDTRLTILASGNIGIGTETPKEKLSVNGKIRAREIKVEITNWPDYVFSKSYCPPTLQEIEAHIKEKGHLPDIPSAEEVKTNGIDLGEMNAKLLRKIEELTLHLIEMKKESSQDKINIKELKALTDLLFLEINKMKSKI